MLISATYLRDVFKVKPRLIAHVGAHLGEEAESYRRLGWLDAYWFEANPDLLSSLVANPSIDKSKIVMRAMTDTTDQKITFNIASLSLSSSIFAFRKHSEIYPGIKITNSIEVTTLRLDDYFRDVFPDLINLDIQGSELLALKGAEKILTQVKWIYTEISFIEIYDSGALVGQVDTYLKQFGFARSATRRLYREGWGDALYINTNLCKLPIKNRILEKLSSANWIKNQVIYAVRLQAHNILKPKVR